MEAPPTPPVALGRLLADHELGLRHLAGPAEAELHGVHASEMADPSPYLLGGELLLTAGAGLAAVAWPAGGTEPAPGSRAEPSGAEASPTRDTDHAAGGQAEPSGVGGGPAGVGLADVRPGHGGAGHADSGRAHSGAGSTDQAGTRRADAGRAGAGHAGAGHADAGLIEAGPYVARLVRAGVGAVGFGVTPVHETVPRSLVEACEQYGLPLIEVPPGTPFTAVGRSVWRLMARARTAELRRVTEAQQSLAAAAARPDPVPAVLRRLAAALGGWAGLLPTTRPDAPGATMPGPTVAGPAAAGSGAAPTEAGTGPAPTGASADRPAPTGTGAGPALTEAGTGPGPTGASADRSAPTGTGAGPAPTRASADRPAPTGTGAVRTAPAGTGVGPKPTTAGTGAAPTAPEGPDARQEQGLGAGAAGAEHGPMPAGPAGPSGPAGKVGTAGLSGTAGPATLATLTAPGASAGTAPAPEALDVLTELARRVAPGSAVTATATHGGLHLSVHALGDGRVLALANPTRAPGDHTIASVAAVLLTLLTAHRPAGSEAALTRLLLDGDPATALGPGPWYAVHARGTGDPRALAAALGTVLLDPRGSSVPGDPLREDAARTGSAHPGSVPPGSARAGSVPPGSVRLLTRREPAPQPGWRLGVSAAAEPGGLPGADAQAGRALERAEAARTRLVRHRDPGFSGLVGAAEARAHAEAVLAPLSSALRETLHAWLAHHGSWDRSAAALGIHRNTVRQRISRIAGLLGEADLDDPDTRMELWFALRHTDGPDGP
ncbi:helix-turn-helix domain-containing protein [Streptomyces sp. NPDC099050]|uniref:helix-turn-helix domain-containing protein n=1 Tax=Streptomyces sp. NPDC099050 TaxID=3366100 RepID=UPI00382C085C